MVGFEWSGAYNWSPDCSEHGSDTPWYETEGRTQFETRNVKTAYAQGIAAGTRKMFRESQPLKWCIIHDAPWNEHDGACIDWIAMFKPDDGCSTPVEARLWLP